MKVHLELFIEALPDATLLCAPDGRIIVANNSAYELLGYPISALEHITIEDLVPERFRAQHLGKREAFSWVRGVRRMGEAIYLPTRRSDGTEIMADISIGRFIDPESSIPLLIVTIIDRTIKVQYEEQLIRLANIDALTSLHARRYFIELAEREFARSRRNGNPLTVIYFDIDHFKKVNDTYGHAIGDYLLKQVGALCTKVFRTTDNVGRIGGEEFAAILSDTNMVGAEIAAERLRVLFNQITLDAGDKGTVSMTASFGVAEFKNSDDSLESLLSRADKALYQAKHGGRNQVCISR